MELSLGELGESLALEFLHNRGYRLIYKNYRIKPHGELDLVVFGPEGTLVFVEVKSLCESDKLSPEDNASKAKIRKIAFAARMFVAKHPALLKEDRGYRIDLIAITFKKGDKAEQLTINSEDVVIRHYENLS